MENTGNLIRRQVLKLGALATTALLATGATAQTDDVSRAAATTLNGWISAFNSGEPTARFFTRDATLVFRFIKTFTFKSFGSRSSSTGNAPDERSFRRCL